MLHKASNTPAAEREPVIPATPAPLPTPAAPPAVAPLGATPGLPQRRPAAPISGEIGNNAERIGSPSRPPEEIRSILSRYRSGLETGRAEGGEPTEPSADHTFPDHE